MGELRIIGGQWKRTPIVVHDARGLRPTPDRVRETLFNWLGQWIHGWNCLDLFAGAGSLGLEAGSRGAERVTLVEINPQACRALEHHQATGDRSPKSRQIHSRGFPAGPVNTPAF